MLLSCVSWGLFCWFVRRDRWLGSYRLRWICWSEGVDRIDWVDWFSTFWIYNIIISSLLETVDFADTLLCLQLVLLISSFLLAQYLLSIFFLIFLNISDALLDLLYLLVGEDHLVLQQVILIFEPFYPIRIVFLSLFYLSLQKLHLLFEYFVAIDGRRRGNKLQIMVRVLF